MVSRLRFSDFFTALHSAHTCCNYENVKYLCAQYIKRGKLCEKSICSVFPCVIYSQFRPWMVNTPTNQISPALFLLFEHRISQILCERTAYLAMRHVESNSLQPIIASLLAPPSVIQPITVQYLASNVMC